MEFRQLGQFQVSVVGLGGNNFGMRIDERQAKEVVDAAIDAGINFFDTADVYSGGVSEEFLGKAIFKHRDEVVIATKFGNKMSRLLDGKTEPIEGSGGGSRKWIMRAIEDSLRRLNTDRVDLYQMHIPAGDVPIEETLEALTDLVQQGKVREIGCSNFQADLIDESQKVSKENEWARFISSQDHWSLLARHVEEEVVKAVERNGMVEIPYFPLASGLLTGKYTRGEDPAPDTRLGVMAEERRSNWMNERNLEVTEKLQAFAEERGHSLLELAISWLASQKPVVSVIAGATKPEQVRANASAAGWKLDSDELSSVDAITQS